MSPAHVRGCRVARTDVAHIDLARAAAANMAGWHDVHLRALGHATSRRDGIWATPGRLPIIFFNGIALEPDADVMTMTGAMSGTGAASACDPWARLDLGSQGFEADGQHRWMVRLPDDAAGPTAPPELSIERVADPDALDAFERTAERGFGMPAHPRGTWQAPSVLDDPRLLTLVGRVAGEVVTVSMGFIDAGVVGVYGVVTVPEARGRGYGSAMTWAALSADRAIPTVLQPSGLAEPLYSRLGFTPFANFRHWYRPGGPRDD